MSYYILGRTDLQLLRYINIIMRKVILLAAIFSYSFAISNTVLFKCTRWTWTGDVFNRKVICQEWKPLDCSNRMHQKLCELDGTKIPTIKKE